MQKRLFILGVLALIAAAWAAPSFAARPIQGTVGEVTTADGAAIGTVGFRIWSALPGGTTVFNNNVASCRNLRCLRTFVTNSTLAAPGAAGGGGFVGNAENTSVYNSDLAEQPFYELVDGNYHSGLWDHILFYGVSGVVANNSGVGSFLAQTCGATGAQNCFGRIDLATAAPALTSTYPSFGNPGTIRPISGLNPAPTVKVASAGGGAFNLSWTDPVTYSGNMRGSTASPAAASPVLGISLWKNDKTDCSLQTNAPSEVDPGWTLMGNFNLGSTSTTDNTVPAGGCRYYATKVRFLGPGGGEIDTYTVGANSQPANNNPTAVKITRFSATYAGHGKVNVNWTSGVEGSTAAYYVTRGATSNGPFQKVSPRIDAQGDGHSYSFVDDAPQGAKTYYYQLEIVGRDGGVTASNPASVQMPGRTKKAGPKL